MSNAAKATLATTTLSAICIVVFVHYQQRADKAVRLLTASSYARVKSNICGRPCTKASSVTWSSRRSNENGSWTSKCNDKWRKSIAGSRKSVMGRIARRRSTAARMPAGTMVSCRHIHRLEKARSPHASKGAFRTVLRPVSDNARFRQHLWSAPCLRWQAPPSTPGFHMMIEARPRSMWHKLCQRPIEPTWAAYAPLQAQTNLARPQNTIPMCENLAGLASGSMARAARSHPQLHTQHRKHRKIQI